ncbi:MAG: STAS domain-containing protein [Chloroflexota bacterium]
MKFEVEAYKGKKNITILRIMGNLDGSNYTHLIKKAEELFIDGTQNLLIDMAGCEFMSSAGLLALHNIDLIIRGRKPLNTKDGLRILDQIRVGNEARNPAKFKLVNLPPRIKTTLEQTGMLDFYDHYEKLKKAVASF